MYHVGIRGGRNITANKRHQTRCVKTEGKLCVLVENVGEEKSGYR